VTPLLENSDFVSPELPPPPPLLVDYLLMTAASHGMTSHPPSSSLQPKRMEDDGRYSDY